MATVGGMPALFLTIGVAAFAVLFLFRRRQGDSGEGVAGFPVCAHCCRRRRGTTALLVPCERSLPVRSRTHRRPGPVHGDARRSAYSRQRCGATKGPHPLPLIGDVLLCLPVLLRDLDSDMRHVASLAAVVGLAMGSAACASTDTDTTADTAGSDPVATSVQQLEADVTAETDVGPPTDAELLDAGDMPTADSWRVGELPAGFWNENFDAISVHICNPTGWSLWKIVSPTDAEHRAGRVLNGPGRIYEAVLTGHSSELKQKFDEITQRLADCLNGSHDPDLAASGWELVAAELPSLEVGDANFLMRQQLYQRSEAEARPFCDHRLAVVLDGSRLVVVEHMVGVDEPMDQNDFALIVENAAQRINA